jgi:hypothetical protein
MGNESFEAFCVMLQVGFINLSLRISIGFCHNFEYNGTFILAHSKRNFNCIANSQEKIRYVIIHCDSPNCHG